MSLSTTNINTNTSPLIHIKHSTKSLRKNQHHFVTLLKRQVSHNHTQLLSFHIYSLNNPTPSTSNQEFQFHVVQFCKKSPSSKIYKPSTVLLFYDKSKLCSTGKSLPVNRVPRAQPGHTRQEQMRCVSVSVTRLGNQLRI